MASLFLMKPANLTPERLRIGKWAWSTKLDGMRAYWDGGITTGRRDVPWALGKIATGLWSNNGNIIYAPSWWLSKLPSMPLDGELWAGVNNFKYVISTCKSHIPDARWKKIIFRVFDMPSYEHVFSFREVKSPTCRITFGSEIRAYIKNRLHEKGLDRKWGEYYVFGSQGLSLPLVSQWASKEVYPVVQEVYNGNWDHFCNEIAPKYLEEGHEGFVFRRLGTVWEPVRSNFIYKYKPWEDAEAVVVDYVLGELTDKGSRLLGKMGSLLCRWQGSDPNSKVFGVSGFTDVERTLVSGKSPEDFVAIATKLAGKVAPSDFECPAFPRGKVITIKYMTLTENKVPREARYYRNAVIE